MTSSPTRILTLLAVFVLFAAGCGPKTSDRPDPFFEKWRELATRSKGYSPSPVEHSPEVTLIREIAIEDEQGVVEKPERPLPTDPVTLRLSNVDVGVLLRALAKAADISIVLSNQVSGELSVDVRNLAWDQVFTEVLKNQGLSYSWDGNLLRVTSVDDLKRQVAIEEATNARMAKRREGKELEPLVTSVIGIRYADATELQEELTSVLTRDDKGETRGSIVVDKHNNTLIVQAIRGDLKRVTKLIDNLDRPRSQILLKAHIVEATKDTARDLGVQWGGFFESNAVDSEGNKIFLSPGLTTTADGVTTPTFGQGASEQSVGINLPADLSGGLGSQVGILYGMLGDSILELQLSALQDDGKVNILSSPSITTLDNQTAFTENGERVPYVATNPEGELEVMFEDAVLRLEITPHVIDAQALRLKVMVKKDEVDLTRTVAGNPFIIKKQTETNLVVEDGETIVISGLSRQRNFDRSSGVPWLEKMPGLGKLFRRDFKGEDMEEVLIFITPSILPYRPAKAEAGPQESPANTPAEAAPAS